MTFRELRILLTRASSLKSDFPHILHEQFVYLTTTSSTILLYSHSSQLSPYTSLAHKYYTQLICNTKRPKMPIYAGDKKELRGIYISLLLMCIWRTHILARVIIPCNSVANYSDDGARARKRERFLSENANIIIYEYKRLYCNNRRRIYAMTSSPF